ncbi:MAG: SEC-C domain-containing protein [Nitrospirae bacterium]|nr:SEC-C domain-containing protein [Nitrospirota bacterium]
MDLRNRIVTVRLTALEYDLIRGKAGDKSISSYVRGLVTKGLVPLSSPQAIGKNAPCPCGSGKKYKKCCYEGVAE